MAKRKVKVKRAACASCGYSTKVRAYRRDDLGRLERAEPVNPRPRGPIQLSTPHRTADGKVRWEDQPRKPVERAAPVFFVCDLCAKTVSEQAPMEGADYSWETLLVARTICHVGNAILDAFRDLKQNGER